MQQETNALNTLCDISEYTSYIDRRITKLSLLYRSLDITKPTDQQQQPHRPYQSPSKFNSTAKSSFNPIRKQSPPSIQSFYATDFKQIKKRYSNPHQKDRNHSDYKSELTSFDRSKEFYSTLKSSKPQSSSKNNNQKLKMYEAVKQEMLGSFYVGSQTRPKHEERKGFYPPLRHSEGEHPPRLRKGKLWHGRPPVKIVQKYV